MGAATYTATAGVRCTRDKDVKRNGNGHSDPADLIGGKTPDRAFWIAQKHATCANTNYLWKCAISALVFLCTGGV